MSHYNLQSYLYDSMRLKWLRKELTELTTTFRGCRWAGDRIAAVSAEITTIQANMSRYEQKPQNRAAGGQE